jgi:hypothetical protein
MQLDVLCIVVVGLRTVRLPGQPRVAKCLLERFSKLFLMDLKAEAVGPA